MLQIIFKYEKSMIYGIQKRPKIKINLKSNYVKGEANDSKENTLLLVWKE